MPTEQLDTLQDVFQGETVPTGDQTIALTHSAGMVDLSYYTKGAPVTLAVVYYGPGNPKGTVVVDGTSHEIPPGTFRSFGFSHYLQMRVTADAGGAKYGWVRTK